MAVETYPGTDEPVPDGKMILVFRTHPWDAVRAPSDDTFLSEHTLHFSQYRYFKYERDFLFARHREGHHERYLLSNILFIQTTTNSPEVAEALNAYRPIAQWRWQEENPTRNTPPYPPRVNFCIDCLGAIRHGQ